MFFGHNSDFSELWTVSSLLEEGTGEDETGFV